jgi:hypothetical protein
LNGRQSSGANMDDGIALAPARFLSIDRRCVEVIAEEQWIGLLGSENDDVATSVGFDSW